MGTQGHPRHSRLQAVSEGHGEVRITDAATREIRASVEVRALMLLSDGMPHTSRELASIAQSAARRVWDACKAFDLEVERRKVGADSWLWIWRDWWRLEEVVAALRLPRGQRVKPKQGALAL